MIRGKGRSSFFDVLSVSFLGDVDTHAVEATCLAAGGVEKVNAPNYVFALRLEIHFDLLFLKFSLIYYTKWFSALALYSNCII